MSLKEDVDYIKKEISAEESFMESFFKLEKFYKKYKTALIGAVVLIVVATAGYYMSSYVKMQNTIETNKAFNKLLKDKDDKEAAIFLKENSKKLYHLAMFSHDKKTTTDIKFIKELSSYTKAIEKNSISSITTVSQKQDFLLKDFALFNKALIQTQNGKYSDAKATLKQIDEKSGVIELAKMLSHFLLTK
ncbi:MAG: hypothetical protein U9R37_06695 [Campylobacterota bacterium]|nr:hypothetical protein [Campylobacterota bacterium]